MTMIGMCVVLVVMVQKASNPGMWRWFVSAPAPQEKVVRDEDNSGQSAPAAPDKQQQPTAKPPADAGAKDAKKIPAATGPTDEDADEAEAAIEEYDYVSDGTTHINLEDNPAYERLVRWVINQPYGRLLARVTQKNPTYGQFRAAPRDFREPGKIFEINLHLRQVVKFDVKMTFDNPDEQHEPVTLYEMWGTTDESRGRFFHLIVFDPPAGLPLGQDVREDVRFVGYFFRLQAYEPGNAKLNAPPLIAPSFIGRIAWQPAAPGGVVSSTELPWMILLGGGVAIVVAVCLGVVLLNRKKRNVAYLATDLPPPPTMSVEEWLDRVDNGANESAQSNGHSDDLDSGETYRNGHSNGSTRLFSDRPDEV
jgi:hypothetical protein